MEPGTTSNLIGSLLGPFRVNACIGVGGMGEVFRARDTRLDRDVAIKILPQRSAGDATLVARFEREARLLATLNHPNIGSIYGFESVGGVHALVLELIEGDTLAERLRFGPLPLKEALVAAQQIAEALDAAHSKGVIHRDLKPANIKLTPSGDVKVLDFGLGKITSGGYDSNESTRPLEPLSMDGTEPGLILGTPAYMSPEQARGEAVDKRTDIWAFGCVLYQMLAGRSAFGRDTMIDTLAAIVEGEPDLSLLPVGASAQLRALLVHCLQKDQRRRLRDIGDAMPLLTYTVGEPLMLAGGSVGGSRRAVLPWMVAAVACVLFAVALAVTLRRAAPAALQVVRSTIELEGGDTLVTGNAEMPLALSADGTRIAYVAYKDGHRVLYVRELNSLEQRALVQVDDVRHPFFSPDGESIGYFAGGSLQTVAVSGGPPLRICDAAGVSKGGSWGANHVIVFGMDHTDLMRVSDTGGTPVALTGSAPAAWPEIMPDGTSVLFTTGVMNENLEGLAVMPIGGGAKKIVARLSSSALNGPANIGSGGGLLQAHVVPGYLLYGQSPGVVRAVRFDPKTLAISGAPVSLSSSVERAMNGGGVYFTVSQTGLLVYASTGSRHQVVWVDRKGNVTPLTADLAAYRTPQLSPDGKQIAVAVSDDTRRSDIWLIDAMRGSRQRLTTKAHNLSPAWSTDGKRLDFATTGGINEISPIDGHVRTLVTMSGAYPDSWSPDSKSLLINANSANGSALWLFTPDDNGKPSIHPLTRGVGSYGSPQYSPDGRWITYASLNSGRQEVYIAHAPDASDPVVVSTNGGGAPRWAPSDKELFYLESDTMMRVAVTTTNGLQVGKPERLFSGHFAGEGHDKTFDITKDGQRFLMVKSDEAAVLSRLTVVQNWTQELQP